MAREQGALFWELRAALSLARLKATQGRPEEAKRVLTPVYDRFTEGFETADLRAARAMLELPMTGFAAVPGGEVRFAPDSPLEEARFEPSVPLWLGAFTRSKTSMSGPSG